MLARRQLLLGGVAGAGLLVVAPPAGALTPPSPYTRTRGGPDIIAARLPPRISITEPFTDTTLLVRTRVPVRDVVVRLHNPKNTSPLTAVDEVDQRTPRTETYVRLAYHDFQWALWGWHDWRVWVSRSLADGSTVRSVRTQPLEVKPGSTLVSRAVRQADTVVVTGQADLYSTTTRRFRAWEGRPVRVERAVGGGWQEVGSTTTDERGRFRLATSAPVTTQLRCSTVGTTVAWGAVGDVLTV